MNPQTITTYNARAQEYDEETADFWDLFPQTFIEAFVSRTGPKIIDVGSGPGRDGVLLQQAGKEVLCVDAAEAMVALSAARGLASVCASFESLPVTDASYDGVWAYTSLLHVPKAEVGVVLAEIVRVLKPGGMLALGLIEGDGEGYRESSGVDMPRWFSYYQKEEVITRCQEYGFTLVYFEVFKPRTRNYLNFIFKKSR
ncbi:MAG: hypothetical protein RL150_186 [Candidatus Parcubacteria bacterium]